MILSRWRRICRQLLPLSLSLLWAAPVAAQDQITYLDPPPATSDAYAQSLTGTRASSDIRYVDETDFDLLGDIPEQERPEVEYTQIPAGDGAGNTLIAIMAVFALVAAFILATGSGTLLARDPAARPPRKRNTAWGLTSDEEETGDILARVRAMPSRRDALILLLRHCLLRAADESEATILRGDTEREVYARLPDTWHAMVPLGQLLHQTELVHYGGRTIADETFETLLSDAGRILNGGATHG